MAVPSETSDERPAGDRVHPASRAGTATPLPWPTSRSRSGRASRACSATTAPASRRLSSCAPASPRRARVPCASSASSRATPRRVRAGRRRPRPEPAVAVSDRARGRPAVRAAAQGRGSGRRRPDGARDGRPDRRRGAQGGRLLARHAPAREAGPGARPRARPAAARRAAERPRSGAAARDHRRAAPAGRRGPHRDRVVTRPARGRADGAAGARARERPPGRRGPDDRHPPVDQRAARTIRVAAGGDGRPLARRAGRRRRRRRCPASRTARSSSRPATSTGSAVCCRPSRSARTRSSARIEPVGDDLESVYAYLHERAREPAGDLAGLRPDPAVAAPPAAHDRPRPAGGERRS